VRVNLIHSKLVFQKKNIVHIHVNSASEFLIHCTGFSREKKALFTLMNSAEKKSSRELLYFYLRFKRKTQWIPSKINCVLNITKQLFAYGYFKYKSNHANKPTLNLRGRIV